MKHLTILLFGPPGAGKGTAGQDIAFPWTHYAATGDMVRNILKAEQHPLKESVLSYISQGKLVPDETICTIFRDYLQNVPQGKTLLLDGIPRTPTQAASLDDILDVRAIMHFTNLPNHTLKNRILARAQAAMAAGKEPRKDDTPAAVENRIAEYYTHTRPTLDVYAARDIPIYCVNALASKEDVRRQLSTYVSIVF